MSRTYSASLKTSFWSLCFSRSSLVLYFCSLVFKANFKIFSSSNIFHRHFSLLLIIVLWDKGIITAWLWPWLSIKKHCPRFRGETPSGTPSHFTVNLQFSRKDNAYNKTMTSVWDYLWENARVSSTYNKGCEQ